MKHPVLLALLISTPLAFGDEEFKLQLDGLAKPTIPMPPKPAADESVRGPKKLSDVSRSYFGVVSYTSTLERDLRNLKATPLEISDAASVHALRNATSSAESVARHLTWLRAIAQTAANQTLVQKAIKDAEDAMSRYEQLREEMVERKK